MADEIIKEDVRVDEAEPVVEEPARDDDELVQILRSIVDKLDVLITNSKRPETTPMPAKVETTEETVSIYDM